MIEADWWGATSPDKPLDWLFFDSRAADRKLRLFCVACCRRVEHLAGGAPFPFLLRSIEAYADGEQDEDRLCNAVDSVRLWHRDRGFPSPREEEEFATQRAILAAGRIPEPQWKDLARGRHTYQYDADGPYPRELALAFADTYRQSCPVDVAWGVMIRHLHDIFGPLPFREVAVDPQWLTADVVAIAKGIYDEKAFDRLPILADALQDAGCDNDELLKHCRAEKWEHVRGCWVVDLLLGRDWREPAP
jgi:hypothetical protein